MQKYARNIENRAVDVITGDPAELFHPAVAGQFIPVPEHVVEGSIFDPQTGEWSAPAVVPAPSGPTYRTIVSRTEYYGLFTPAEEAMIRMMAKSDITMEMLQAAAPSEQQELMAVASLQVMLSRTDALASTDTIDLKNHQVQKGLDLLVGLSLLTSARRAEIALGVPA